MIAAAGGSAAVFGHSSGATLALKAAATGLPITHLVLYEPPFNTDDNYPVLPPGFAGELAELVAAGRCGDAVELYQAQAVGIPQEVVAQMRHTPPVLHRPASGPARTPRTHARPAILPLYRSTHQNNLIWSAYLPSQE